MTEQNKPYPVLYVIVRNDLESMNPGKAEAHSGHAACQFMYENVVQKLEGNIGVNDIVKVWMKAGNGFGTQINLDGSFEDICSIEDYLENLICWGGKDVILYKEVLDPTYPYIDMVTGECRTRCEVTAFYVFGMSDNARLKSAVGKLRLKP